MAFPINAEGVGLIKDFEGLRLEAYRCPAGIWTIGYGHTDGVAKGDKITRAQADAYLASDLQSFAAAVRNACKVKPNPNQLAAMASLAFNIGTGAFQKSTVLKRHNAGDTAAASRAFGMWNKATVDGKKVVMPGLVSRRAREAALYLKAAKAADRTPMPQAVADEPPAINNADMRIKAGGVVLGAAGPVAKAAEVAQQVGEVGWAFQSVLELGFWTLAVLGVLGVGGYFIWRAIERRNQGRE
jgi:lysozyme